MTAICRKYNAIYLWMVFCPLQGQPCFHVHLPEHWESKIRLPPREIKVRPGWYVNVLCWFAIPVSKCLPHTIHTPNPLLSSEFLCFGVDPIGIKSFLLVFLGYPFIPL